MTVMMLEVDPEKMMQHLVGSCKREESAVMGQMAFGYSVPEVQSDFTC